MGGSAETGGRHRERHKTTTGRAACHHVGMPENGAGSRSDVVVIGAGLAGLLCASTLESRGFGVDLIEASDAVGGRVRTDVIDGHRCDRGFQLLNPAYPAVRRYVDLKALDLRTFDAGVAVSGPDGLRVVADPLRAPRFLGRTLSSGYLNPLELARLARWAAPALGSVRRLVEADDTTLAESLDAAMVTGRLRREILDPFLTGVLADSTGVTSANFTRLLLRSFLLGSPGVPAGGMTALPEQLAAGLQAPPRLGVRAIGLREGLQGPVVRTDQGETSARAVVIATDPSAASGLLPIVSPRMKGLTTYWFSVRTAPTELNLLLVDGRGPGAGPVVNTAVMSHAAPSYAPEGRHLVQATILWPNDVDEKHVREHLHRIYGVATGDWELLVRHDITEALPHQRPPLVHRQPVALGNGLFVAGDHRDTASIQGALVSGRRAANAVSAAFRHGT